MDDLGVPLFLETPIYDYLCLCSRASRDPFCMFGFLYVSYTSALGISQVVHEFVVPVSDISALDIQGTSSIRTQWRKIANCRCAT